MSAPSKQLIELARGLRRPEHLHRTRSLARQDCGVEAFNVDDKSIGLFPTLKDATAALASSAVPS